MSITITQQPLDYTPSNGQHAYNVISTLSGSTDFRYVFDIYLNPQQSTEKLIARVKIAPNTFGVGIVDIGDIVKNYLKPNPRSSTPQAYGDGNFQTNTPNGLIINAQKDYNGASLIPSNSFNTNSAYEDLPHIAEYRVIVGEEYTTSSGTTLVICDDPSVPPSTIEYNLTTEVVSYSGDPNTINWSNTATGPSWGSNVDSGWTYYHYSIFNTLIASGTSTSSSGTYTAAEEPLPEDIFYLYENATGCLITFLWQCAVCEASGWNFISKNCPACYTSLGDIITIWPGVQENKTNFNYNNFYWTGNTNGTNNFKYWEQYKNEFETLTGITENTPAEFLTTFGDELYSLDITLGTGTTINSRVRKRNHHYQCPILLSYFYRDFQDILASPTSFFNLVLTGDTSSNSYSNTTATVLTPTAAASTFDTRPDNRIMYSTMRGGIVQPDRKILTFIGSGTTLQNRVSEMTEWIIYGDDCMSDPQHFCFLNSLGVWDTYTFDRKNIKTYEKENSFYAQGVIRNSPVYNPFFYSKRDTIYDQTVLEIVEAQSNFMDENERKIVEELFLSTSVYLIQDINYYEDGAPQYKKTPYLIPIVIVSNSLQEYKQRYNKLFQYTLTYRYNPNQLFRSNL